MGDFNLALPGPGFISFFNFLRPAFSKPENDRYKYFQYRCDKGNKIK